MKAWPSLRACTDVNIEECGGIKMKRNQCIATSEPIYNCLRNRYRELVPHPVLVKKGTDKEKALSKGVYELYDAPKEKEVDPVKDDGIVSESDSEGGKDTDENPAPWTEDSLLKMNKADLLALAQEAWQLEVPAEATKKEIAALILEAQE